MKQFPRSFQPALLALALLLISGCEGFGETATSRANATPVPTPTIIPLSTGDGQLDDFLRDYELDLIKHCISPCDGTIYQKTAGTKSLRLDVFVSKAGPPDKVVAVRRMMGEANEMMYYLYYVTKGWSVVGIETSQGVPKVTPGLELTSLRLWDSREPDKLAEELRIKSGRPDVFLAAQRWEGYGVVTLFKPP